MVVMFLLITYFCTTDIIEFTFTMLLCLINLQVFTRLQKLLLCVSHKSTLSFIDKLGQNYDEPVKSWKEDIESRKLQVSLWHIFSLKSIVKF